MVCNMANRWNDLVKRLVSSVHFQYIFYRKKSRCTTPVPCQTVYFGSLVSAACQHIYEAHILQSTAHFRTITLEGRQQRCQVLWRPGRVTTIAAPIRNYELKNITVTFWICLYSAQLFKICRVLKIICFQLIFFIFPSPRLCRPGRAYHSPIPNPATSLNVGIRNTSDHTRVVPS